MKRIGWIALLLLALALPLGMVTTAVQAQEAAAIELDEGGFGMVKNEPLAAGAEIGYSVALKAGDWLAIDLQSKSDSLAVAQFLGADGALDLQNPAPFAYLASAPADGSYTLMVKNTGADAAGFTLRVAVSSAPLPTKQIISEEMAGQTIPVVAGELFQVALDAPLADGYSWGLGEYDLEVLKLEDDPAGVLLGTMPGAMSRQIFTFSALAAGTATLDFVYFKEGAEPEKSFSVTIDVSDGEATPSEEPGAPAETEAAAVAPAPIQLAQGNVLVIPLAGNPTTGYTWQFTSSPGDILVSRGDAAYLPESSLSGAPGVQVFTFDAAGAGEVSLNFTYSQPWDEKTPPEQAFDLAFTVAARAAPVVEATPAPPEPVVIGDSDNGGSVTVQVGGKLLVDLSGNPTTGYIWQITNKDDAILQPADYAFQADSEAMGAGGVEHFEFDAVAPGEVELAFAQSRPWESEAEPVATYAVTVTVVDAGQ